MPLAGIEPALLAELDFESSASTNSATGAYGREYHAPQRRVNLSRAGERMLDSRLVFRCPIGGIGRRARLKIEFRKKCWFDPGMGHQISLNKWILDFAHAPKGEGMSLGG